MDEQSQYLVTGDSGLTIEMGKVISEETNQRIRAMVTAIEEATLEGVEELVPTYCTILVIYNPVIIGYSELKEKLMKLEGTLEKKSFQKPEVVHIPTFYGGSAGMDIEFVAAHNGLMVEDVIRLHSEAYYLVYMLGFTPGFPYLGGMTPSIATPRLEVPREKISAGSVGIAGNQTGIYPFESPGGWQIIGKTPLNLFNVYEKPYSLLQSGQYVKFDPIDEAAYHQILEEIQLGRYKVYKSPYERTE